MKNFVFFRKVIIISVVNDVLVASIRGGNGSNGNASKMNAGQNASGNIQQGNLQQQMNPNLGGSLSGLGGVGPTNASFAASRGIGSSPMGVMSTGNNFNSITPGIGNVGMGNTSLFGSSNTMNNQTGIGMMNNGLMNTGGIGMMNPSPGGFGSFNTPKPDQSLFGSGRLF